MRAVIDIGSNSVKYLLSSGESRSWVTRLGKDLREGDLNESSVKATEEAFVEMHAHMQKHLRKNSGGSVSGNLGDGLDFDQAAPLEIVAVATSAVRDCRNPQAIARAVRREFQIPLHVLSGQAEAEYSMSGARRAAEVAYGPALGTEGRCVFVDVGGASTEVGMLESRRGEIAEPARAFSFQAGAVRCHEAWGLAEMPVSDATWSAARKSAQKTFATAELARVSGAAAGSPPNSMLKTPRAVAVGGSLVLAAKLMGCEPLPGGAGFWATPARYAELNEKLRRLSLLERLALPQMKAGRADILCAGVLCLLAPLEALGVDNVVVTGWGLRHGILERWDELLSRSDWRDEGPDLRRLDASDH